MKRYLRRVRGEEEQQAPRRNPSRQAKETLTASQNHNSDTPRENRPPRTNQTTIDAMKCVLAWVCEDHDAREARVANIPVPEDPTPCTEDSFVPDYSTEIVMDCVNELILDPDLRDKNKRNKQFIANMVVYQMALFKNMVDSDGIPYQSIKIQKPPLGLYSHIVMKSMEVAVAAAATHGEDNDDGFRFYDQEPPYASTR